MDPREIRVHSLLVAKSLGCKSNDRLPLLDKKLTPRPVSKVVERSLALFAVVSASYGFAKESAIAWLENEGAFGSLAGSEKRFLNGEEGDLSIFQSQVEGLNVLGWALGFVRSLEFDQVCDNSLIRIFPDIKNNVSSSAFRAQARFRKLEEITRALDLAYCLHWEVVQNQIEGRQQAPGIKPHVIVERRRALEWILSAEDWDELDLDT